MSSVETTAKIMETASRLSFAQLEALVIYAEQLAAEHRARTRAMQISLVQISASSKM